MRTKAIDRLFARFDAALTDGRYLAMTDQIIDTTGVPAPQQRKAKAETAATKMFADPKQLKPVDLAIAA